MPFDPTFAPPEMKQAADKLSAARSLRAAIIVMLMRIRGNRFTPKSTIDWYFRFATPALRINHWRHRCFKRRRSDVLKLNLGSGSQYLPGFVNIEGLIIWKKDMWLDIRHALPFADNSVDVIYSHHVFEHFDLRTLRNVLRECHRVLKPGGRFRFVTPNLRKVMESYIGGDMASFTETAEDVRSFGGRFNNEMLCQNHHMVMLDFDFFVELLEDAGKWSSLVEGGFENSISLTPEELNQLEGERRATVHRSLVVEGIKS